MNRTPIFSVLAAAGVVGLLALTAWYLGSYQHGGTVGGVMGQMMGTGYADGMTSTMPGWVWGGFVGLALLVGAGFVGLAYYLAYPEIPSAPGPAAPSSTPVGMETEAPTGMGWDVLMRTSKPEEKRALEVLAAHHGSYLQKFVVKEAGLSKLKTHRIVSRLAERGVVQVERSGNTNQVSFSPWVKARESKPANS